MTSPPLAVPAPRLTGTLVMYYGRIVEYATIKEIFSHPMHPYTYGLLHSIPRGDQPRTREPLPAIRGVVPNPYIAPKGCKFHPRCNFAKDKCRSIEPDYVKFLPLMQFDVGLRSRYKNNLMPAEELNHERKKYQS